jgi:hypothetical protein
MTGKRTEWSGERALSCGVKVADGKPYPTAARKQDCHQTPTVRLAKSVWTGEDLRAAGGGRGVLAVELQGKEGGIPWAGRSQKTQPATWRWRWRLVPLQKALEHLWPIWRRNRRVSRGTRSRATAWVPP